MSHTTDDYEHVLRDEGVQAVAYDDEAGEVKVFVREKLPEDELPEERLVAERISAQETDVIEVGDITAQPSYQPDVQSEGAPDHRGNQEPPVAGASEIQAGSTAATAGLLARVTDPSTSTANWSDAVEAGEFVRISNAHVYGSARGELGNPIVQPSPLDGGDEDDTVGWFAGFVPLEDSIVDAAARRLQEREPNDLLGIEFADVDAVRREGYDELDGETLVKSGRTTGVTTGEVVATNAAVSISYGSRTITKRGQLLATSMSEGGDSGSPVLCGTADAPTEIVGHLFAGSDRITVINRASDVENRLGVELLTASDESVGQPQTFADYIESQLIKNHGAANVWRHFKFRTGRYADFVVANHDEQRIEAWELENDANDVILAAGQAQFAAASATETAVADYEAALPVVCLPTGKIDPDERPIFERLGLQIQEIDLPDGVSAEGV